jgi:hypothetical protein
VSIDEKRLQNLFHKISLLVFLSKLFDHSKTLKLKKMKNINHFKLFIERPTIFGDSKGARRRKLELRLVVNFTNILRAAYTQVSCTRRFFVLKF